MKRTVHILLTAFIVFTVFIHCSEPFAYAVTIFTSSPVTVILDAGHGGEDCGALADDGTKEKDINLKITEKIAVFLELFGIDFIKTRDSDISVCDDGLNSIRQRKVSDIKNRYALVTQTPASVLLSIHQNYYNSSECSGTQVFYGASAAGSEELAEYIQNSVKEYVQPENLRNVKPSTGTIYLLDKAVRPSVMVECGFLSNNDEASKLKDGKYQSVLAFFIVRGLSSYLLSEKEV